MQTKITKFFIFIDVFHLVSHNIEQMFGNCSLKNNYVYTAKEHFNFPAEQTSKQKANMSHYYLFLEHLT